MLLSQDVAGATLISRAARREQIPLDICADVPSAIEMISRKGYQAVLFDFDLLGSRDLFSSFSGHKQKPIGLAILPAAASLSDAFAAGLALAIHKPLSIQPVRLGLKAAYEFGRWARRKSPRAGISIPALVGIARNRVLHGSILNFSEKGACLVLEQEVHSGTFMTVRFALPGASLIDIGAMVIWGGGGRAGVQFHRLHCRYRAGIGAWVREAMGVAGNAPMVASSERAGRLLL